MEFWIFLAIGIVLLIIWVVKSTKQEVDPNKKTREELFEYYENQRLHGGDGNAVADDDNVQVGADDLITYIAGINFRCGIEDIGGFLGYTRPEPDNPHDHNAVAIIRNDGKHLGYVPAKELSLYHSETDGGEYPCVGYITEGESQTVNGRVKIIFSRDGKVIDCAAASYVRWLLQNKGKRYLPKHFDFIGDKQPRTKQEMIDAITEYIDSL